LCYNYRFVSLKSEIKSCVSILLKIDSYLHLIEDRIFVPSMYVYSLPVSFQTSCHATHIYYNLLGSETDEERRGFTAREAGARLLVSYLHSHLLLVLLLRFVLSFRSSKKIITPKIFGLVRINDEMGPSQSKWQSKSQEERRDSLALRKEFPTKAIALRSSHITAHRGMVTDMRAYVSGHFTGLKSKEQVALCTP